MDARSDDDRGMDATNSQLAELRQLGIEEAELEGLTAADADEWIDALRARRTDAGQFGTASRQRKRQA